MLKINRSGELTQAIPSKKVRLNLELPAETRDQIERIRSFTEAESVTEVLGRSLRTFRGLIDRSDDTDLRALIARAREMEIPIGRDSRTNLEVTEKFRSNLTAIQQFFGCATEKEVIVRLVAFFSTCIAETQGKGPLLQLVSQSGKSIFLFA